MTLAKKLYELVVLGLIWGPVAALSVLVLDKVEDLAGGERTAYALLAAMVIVAWFATESILETLRIDTNYAPD